MRCFACAVDGLSSETDQLLAPQNTSAQAAARHNAARKQPTSVELTAVGASVSDGTKDSLAPSSLGRSWRLRYHAIMASMRLAIDGVAEISSLKTFQIIIAQVFSR